MLLSYHGKILLVGMIVLFFIGIYTWYIKTVIKKNRYSHKSIKIKGYAKIFVMLPARYR